MKIIIYILILLVLLVVCGIVFFTLSQIKQLGRSSNNLYEAAKRSYERYNERRKNHMQHILDFYK